MPHELALVMPIYNEQDCIAHVINSWCQTLSALRIDYHIIALNDGSRDGTAQALAALAGHPRVEVINKTNSGHGPTILMGYRKAVEMADWVFQCDSDDEMRAESFPLLWSQRQEVDAAFGIRSGRVQSIDRKLISACSRLAIRLLFGSGVRDVNVPYRLIRASVLKPIVERIPDDTFAPNVIISGVLSRSRRPLKNIPVPHEGRRTGTVSIMKWKLWRAAFKSLRQTMQCKSLVACITGDTRA